MSLPEPFPPEPLLRSHWREDGYTDDWYLPLDVLLKSPEWNFDGEIPPPLDWSVAYREAFQWLEPRRKSFDVLRLYSFTLHRAGPREANRWYYFFEFSVNRSEQLRDYTVGVIVLLDGTILESRRVKQSLSR
jgi:hypothetical protein